MLKHIALEVIKSDIQNFYIGILNGNVSRKFTLNEDESKELFDVSKQLEVHKLDVNNLQLELFVHESIERDSLCHLCLEVGEAKEMFNKAKDCGYWNRVRNSNGNETYFIRDKNRNMFEVKNKI